MPFDSATARARNKCAAFMSAGIACFLEQFSPEPLLHKGSVSAPLRSAQNRGPPDLVRPITCFTKYPQDKPEGIFENKLYYFLLSVAYCFCYFGSSACSGRISFSEFAYFSAGFASVTIIASPMSANLTVLISPNFS